MNEAERLAEWMLATPEAIGDADPADLVAQITEAVGGDLTGLWLLDYGAGIGRVASPLMAAGAHLALADPNPEYLELAPAQALKVQLGGAFREVLPLCHHAYSSNVFIHFTWRYAPQALAHMATAVPRGGLVMVQMPIYDQAAEGGGWIDVTTYTDGQVIDWAEAAGLEVLELYRNPGRFDYDRIGSYHSKFQVLRRVRP